MSTIKDTITQYFQHTSSFPRDLVIWLNPFTWIGYGFTLLYIFVQRLFIIPFFKPPTPPNKEYPTKPFGKVAVVGAGLTGISSAAHCIGHNFDVTIFEQLSREKGLGGIWRSVNKSSGLQLNSALYRFHPAVLWKRAFPQRDEILGEIEKIWTEYNLDSRTKFDTAVKSIRRAPREMYESSKDVERSRWIINNDESTLYDGVIVTIGTCGPPQFPPWANQAFESRTPDESEKHSRQPRKPIIVHSSQLDDLDEAMIRKMKRAIVVGSGASGVETVEWLMEHIYETEELPNAPPEVLMLARDDKWIIPRNTMIDTLIACQPFGREMPLSFLWEEFLKFVHYRGVKDLAPDNGQGLFEGTPIVNDTFLKHVRKGRCRYVRGETLGFSEDGKGIVFRERKRGQFEGKDQLPEQTIEADLIVLATGFKKPQIDFFDDEASVFPQDYDRPNLYLQNFSTEDWSVLTTNSAYVNAIGTVGHVHIGIYTRILLTLIMDPSARPSPKDMKLWVDVVRFIKRGAKGGALGFFTYAELTIWLLTFHLFRPDRLKWIFFIMQGWSVHGEK